jgi:hypothetical protein
MASSKDIGSIFGLTSLLAILASGDKVRALLRHVLTLAVVTLHGLRTLSEHVGTLAARADQRVRALGDEVALLLAVAAASGALLGALLGKVALLMTVTALNRSRRLGTVGLVVALSGYQQGSSYASGCE